VCSGGGGGVARSDLQQEMVRMIINDEREEARGAIGRFLNVSSTFLREF